MATKFLNSGSVPDYLQEHYGIKAKPRTLDEWATRGGGPPFHKFGNSAPTRLNNSTHGRLRDLGHWSIQHQN
jgi:hypothetical protein